MSRLSSADRAVIRKLAETQAEHGRQIRRLARRSPARYVAQEGGTSEVYDDDGKLRAVVGELDDGTYGVAVGTDRETLEPLATTGQVAVKTTTTRGPNPPDDAPGTAGDQWFQTDEFGRVLGWWVHDGTVWQPQELTGVMLAVDALDGRLITGTTLRTAADGQRIVIRDDGDIGVVEAFSGHPKESEPSRINPFTGPNGQVGIDIRSGRSTGSTARAGVIVASGTTDDLGNPIPSDASLFGQRVFVNGSEAIYLGGPVQVTNGGTLHSPELYADTQIGTGFANALLSGQGRIVRDTSTRKAKRDIRDMPLHVARRVLKVRPVLYRRRAETDGPTYPGFIAEEAADVGADLWVTRNADGEPDGIRYPEVAVAHNAILADLVARVEELEALLSPPAAP